MVKETFTEQARERLQRQLRDIDEVTVALREKIEPIERTIDYLDRLRDDLVDQSAGAEIAGTCECGRLLFEGELGHSCIDGPLLCVSCAPTWNDLAAQYREPGYEPIDQDDGALDLTTIEARIAAGDGDKKHVWPL